MSWAVLFLKESSHESCQIAGIRWAVAFDDVPTPAIPGDEVLVKIRSTAVNHLDLVEASGSLKQILPIDLPWIPGHEFSGVVEQIGSDVAAWAPGDAVFGATTGTGAYAEYVAVKAISSSSNPCARTSMPIAIQPTRAGSQRHVMSRLGKHLLCSTGARRGRGPFLPCRVAYRLCQNCNSLNIQGR